MSRMNCLGLLFLALTGCATAEVNTAGAQVALTPNAPDAKCQSLGTVFGQGGGALGGAYIANAELMQYAINDARNKAAALGATHLQTTPPQFGTAGQGVTTTATVMGYAFRCPADGQPGAAAPAPPAPGAAAVGCRASEDPRWKDASPVEKKQMLQDCRQPPSP